MLHETRFELEPGMVFATNNPQGVGTIIEFMEKWMSHDLHADYGHTGIIQNELGLTFEAVWRITEQNFFQAYKGQRVLIARPIADTMQKQVALEVCKEAYLGGIYPLWRLPLFLIPPIARRISYKGKFVVCSELTAKFLYLCGVRHGVFMGTNPDDLVDEWRRWRDFDIVWEGVL